MSIQWNNELYHYGMPRRSGRYKWGSGKNPYQNGANASGKRLANQRNTYDIERSRAAVERSRAAVNREGQKLINRSLGLQKDFGSYKNVDDEEYFEYVARTEYGLNTDTYWNKVKDKNNYIKHFKENQKKLRMTKR